VPQVSWILADVLSGLAVLVQLKVHGTGPSAGLVEERVAYGGHPAQHLLFFSPEDSSPETPLVYFVHGGSWHHGSPATYRAVGRFLASQGYAVALGGYRLAPEHIFPAQLDDVLAGLAAAVTHARSAGVRAEPVLLVGQSAGAHLAALAAFDEESRGAAGLGDLRLAGLLAVSGPLDFDLLCPDPGDCPLVEALMGGREGWDVANPVRYVHGAAPLPVLCVHGARDPRVPCAVSASFVMRANGADGDHATFIADPAGHHVDMTRLLLGASPILSPVLEWMMAAARS
jgi:acetyl esterase/lipase